LGIVTAIGRGAHPGWQIPNRKRGQSNTGCELPTAGQTVGFPTIARAFLLVEQNAKQSLKIADRGCLIESGRIIGSGSSAALKEDPAVQRAYLGAGEVHAPQPRA
jgi:hypothetical protein